MTKDLTDAEVLNRLCVLAAQSSEVDVSAVTPESDFYRDLNFDSLDAVEYVMKLEDEFDVTIDDAQVEQVRTPQQAFELLMPLLRKKGN